MQKCWFKIQKCLTARYKQGLHQYFFTLNNHFVKVRNYTPLRCLCDFFDILGTQFRRFHRILFAFNERFVTQTKHFVTQKVKKQLRKNICLLNSKMIFCCKNATKIHETWTIKNVKNAKQMKKPLDVMLNILYNILIEQKEAR